MNNKLSKECIKAISKVFPMKNGVPTYCFYREGATEALTNPSIYEKAGLISLEEMDFFIKWKYRYYRSESERAMDSDSVEQEKEIFKRLRNYTTAQLFTIYQEQKEK